MHLPSQLRSFALTLPVLAALTACAAFNGKKDSLEQVDDLVVRIERVYVECELSSQRMHEALESLQVLTAPEFDGDPIAAYDDLLAAIERSEKQSARLGASLEPMKSAAEAFFAQWTTDLEAFTSVKMRERSETRLAETRARYDAILGSAEPAKAALDELNMGLRDHAIYLGNDFNPTAVAEIEDEIAWLAETVEHLDADFQVALAAAHDYTRAAGLPERVASSRAAGGEDADTRN